MGVILVVKEVQEELGFLYSSLKVAAEPVELLKGLPAAVYPGPSFVELFLRLRLTKLARNIRGVKIFLDQF